MPHCSVDSFRISVSLLVFFHLEDLPIDVNGESKLLLLLYSHQCPLFSSLSICFMYLDAPILGAYILMNIISSSCFDPYIIIWCPFLSFFVALF